LGTLQKPTAWRTLTLMTARSGLEVGSPNTRFTGFGIKVSSKPSQNS
jgi:hypothetical protein